MFFLILRSFDGLEFLENLGCYFFFIIKKYKTIPQSDAVSLSKCCTKKTQSPTKFHEFSNEHVINI